MSVYIGATGKAKYVVIHYRYDKIGGYKPVKTIEFKSKKDAKEYAEMVSKDMYVLKKR